MHRSTESRERVFEEMSPLSISGSIPLVNLISIADSLLSDLEQLFSFSTSMFTFSSPPSILHVCTTLPILPADLKPHF